MEHGPPETLATILPEQRETVREATELSKKLLPCLSQSDSPHIERSQLAGEHHGLSPTETLRLTEYALVCAIQSVAHSEPWTEWLKRVSREGLPPVSPLRALAGLIRIGGASMLRNGPCHGAHRVGTVNEACLVIFAVSRTIQIPCTHLDRVLGGRYRRTGCLQFQSTESVPLPFFPLRQRCARDWICGHFFP